MRTRIGVFAGVTVSVIAAAVAAMFAFGAPMAPQAASRVAAPAGAAVSQPPAGGPGAQASGSDPLSVEIPGCVCHSDDPRVVAEHAGYRMSECFECHSGGVPEMGQ